MAEHSTPEINPPAPALEVVAKPTALSGTVTLVANDVHVVGTDTRFTSELGTGAPPYTYIYVTGIGVFQVALVEDDTHLELQTPPAAAVTDAALWLCGLMLRVHGNGLAPCLTVGAQGNVGIGTDNPQNALDVFGGVNARWFQGDGTRIINISFSQISGRLSPGQLPPEAATTAALKALEDRVAALE